MGGNLIYYSGNVSTPTADLAILKFLLNSNNSLPVSCLVMRDIINFYLDALSKCYEYMRLSLNLLPEEIILRYKLLEISQDRYVYLEIWKGMY